MIKCEVIEQFTLKDFYKLNNIKRKSIDVKGTLFIGDTFECDENMVRYLTGKNELGKIVVKVIEVKPETPTIIGHRTDDVEYVVSLDNENMEKISKAIVESLNIKKEIKPKKKSSKK